MIDYALVLSVNYAGSQWALDGNDYNTLQWFSDTPKPTQAELDAAWPQVNYNNQVAQVETTRRTEYEAQSDGVFFAWQRGDATELQWREAVAKVKAANPYPPAPPTKK
tara:strand:+ start:449 stop:772 length:324 start_codon:yes stop_codon:yes gene_type:complete